MAAGAVASAGVGSVSRPADVQATAQRLDARRLVGPPPEVVEAQTATDLVNARRAEHGKAALAWSDEVGLAAFVHSTDMATTRTMQHDGSDGSNAGDRLHDAGFDWRNWGEAIGAGQQSAADIVQAWMDSPPHRKILLGDFRVIGVSMVADANGVPYWTLVVAS